MSNYSVSDRVHSRGYAEFLSAARPHSWVAQNSDGKWEVRVKSS